MADAAKQQLLESLKNSLTSGRYSDLTITCGSDSYSVHKFIVCERAEFFARAVKFGGQESHNNAVDLPDDEPAIIKLLIQYLYEGEYEPKLPDDDDPASAAEIAKKAAILAEQRLHFNRIFPHTCTEMSVEAECDGGLCDHHICWRQCDGDCYHFVCEQCQSNLSKPPAIPGPPEQLVTHAKLYEVADKYDVVGLKDLVVRKFNLACAEFWEDDSFTIAAHYAFSTTPDHDKGLRDIICEIISKEMINLIKKPSVEALLTEFNGLAYGLLKAKIEEGWE